MGVPGFFLWLMKNYKKEGFVFSKERLSMVDIKKLNNQEQIDKALKTNLYVEPLLNEVNSIDWFLIDANCLIHPVCFKVVAENPDLKDNAKLEAKMMISVLNYLDKLIQYVNPKKGVYLAIDGVAPVAKIKQQRMRRFKSIADKMIITYLPAEYKKLFDKLFFVKYKVLDTKTIRNLLIKNLVQNIQAYEKNREEVSFNMIKAPRK